MEVALANGGVALIDDADYEAIRPYRWSAHRQSTGHIYAVARTARNNYVRHTIRMHRIILAPAAGLFVDHINGDGLDNRRANLRLCTPSQNSQNQRLRREAATSQFKGVSRTGKTDQRPWFAAVYVAGVRRFSGLFATEIEAALAYDDAARRLHGDFARVNFPRSGEQEAATARTRGEPPLEVQKHAEGGMSERLHDQNSEPAREG